MWRGDGVETTSAPSSNDCAGSDTGLFAFEAAGLAWLREAHEEQQGVPDSLGGATSTVTI